MRWFLPVILLSICLCNSAPAQEKAASQPKDQKERTSGETRESTNPAAAKLPMRRVVLYKNGVGYFEHLGRVRSSQ